MREKLTKSQAFRSGAGKSGIKPAKKILFRHAKIINGLTEQSDANDLLIIDGNITDIKPEISLPPDFNGEIFDLQNRLICPGFLDMHVHFREPGREDEETLLSGAQAAMAGGFSAVCPMPNTQPVTDNREIIEFVFDEMKDHLVSVYPVAATTKGQKGEELVEMAELIDAGVVAFSDDGKSVANSLVLRRALEYARMFDVPIIEHCEDAALAEGGAMHEGFVSTNLGLAGIPTIAEDLVVARNIMLAEFTNSKIHIAHISTKGAVELVRHAKERGIAVTAEATPHHFSLTDANVNSFDANFKMNPPLRSEEHVQAIIEGLKDGTIDAIATDHAPHSVEEKEVEFDAAPFGIIGLETALGLIIQHLVKPGILNWRQVVEKLSLNPYRILGLSAPKIQIGEMANLTIIDPEANWTVDKTKFKSRSRNTPFDGWKLSGRIFGVMNNGYFFMTEKI
jgi:dihydroorotase